MATSLLRAAWWGASPRLLLALAVVLALRGVAPLPDYLGPYPGSDRRAPARDRAAIGA
ncbi:hypothetical protein HKX41_10475, partial [Salinisphaera sp. USBA-960]|nr:hypothetical protein [Salifodinibacter halophilus]